MIEKIISCSENGKLWFKACSGSAAIQAKSMKLKK